MSRATPTKRRTNVVRRRKGGRSARVVAAVVKATGDEIIEHGYVNLSIERVAERAGVHKTSIYRRWPTKAELLTAFLEIESLSIAPATPPDTGSLEGDSQIVLALAKTFLRERFAALWRAVESEGQHPGVLDAKRRIWEMRVEFFGLIVERAHARGEIDGSLDGEMLTDLFLGAITVRSIARFQRVTEAWIEQLWWQIFASAGYERVQPKRRR